jgi:hypothetical protein
MSSRGHLYSEISVADGINQLPTNDRNKLKTCWFDKNSISSWFKYRYQDDSKYERFGFDGYSKFCFGQFNYFFRIYLPSEELLHGLPMASSVCRHFTIDCYMNTINISTANESFFSKPFVVLTNVFSTKLLIGARDIEKKPINVKKNYNLITGDTTTRTFSTCSLSEAADLYVLDLDPQRKSIKFDRLNKNYNIFEMKKQIYEINIK